MSQPPSTQRPLEGSVHDHAWRNVVGEHGGLRLEYRCDICREVWPSDQAASGIA